MSIVGKWKKCKGKINKNGKEIPIKCKSPHECLPQSGGITEGNQHQEATEEQRQEALSLCRYLQRLIENVLVVIIINCKYICNEMFTLIYCSFSVLQKFFLCAYCFLSLRGTLKH